MEELLNNANIKYNFFKAVDGRELILNKKMFRKSYLQKNRDVQFQFYKGSIGCSLSHIRLWMQIYNNPDYEDEDNILILEDDVQFGPLLQQRIEFNLNNLPKKWDVFYLGRKYLIGKIVNKYYIKGAKTGRKGANTSSYAYVIKKKSCKKIADIIYPLSNTEQDIPLRNNMDQFNAYFLLMPLVKVDMQKFKSCINESNNGKRL